MPKPKKRHLDEDEGPVFDLTIDVERLDEEWLRQPLMYHEAATALAEARLAEQEAKQALDVAKAEVHLEMLESPDEYRLPKTTVDVMAAAVLLQKPVEAAQKRLNQAKYAADVLGAAVAGMDHRKRALENLVELHGRDYFATPVAKSAGARERLHEADKRSVRRRARPRDEDEDDDE